MSGPHRGHWAWHWWLLLIVGHILIDDKPSASLGLLRPSWTHLLFAQPYNVQSQSCPRLDHWNHWGHVVHSVLVTREQERLVSCCGNNNIDCMQKMAALWDMQGEEGVEKKLSDISDGVRRQHLSPSRFSSSNNTRKVCCGTSRFGSPFDVTQ